MYNDFLWRLEYKLWPWFLHMSYGDELRWRFCLAVTPDLDQVKLNDLQRMCPEFIGLLPEVKHFRIMKNTFKLDLFSRAGKPNLDYFHLFIIQRGLKATETEVTYSRPKNSSHNGVQVLTGSFSVQLHKTQTPQTDSHIIIILLGLIFSHRFTFLMQFLIFKCQRCFFITMF